jgi:hypothetical protein
LKTRSGTGITQYIVTTHSPILPDLIPKDALSVVRRTEAGTQIEPFATWGPLAPRQAIQHGLDDDGEPLPVSERLLRGEGIGIGNSTARASARAGEPK